MRFIYRIRLCFPVKYKPYGGMYTFLWNLMRFADRRGIRITDDITDDYDVLLANSWATEYRAIRRAKSRLKSLRVIHRVNGSGTNYGRTDDCDLIQARASLLADLTIFQSHYSKYITTDNVHAEFFNAYGVACVKLDRFEAAYYAFKRAFLLDIDDLVIFYNLISMAFRTERQSIAHGLSEIYITVTKDNPKYLKQRKLIKEVFQSTKRKSEEPNPSSKPYTLFV